MEIKTHACDVCGIHKTDSNHWWLLTPNYPVDSKQCIGCGLITWERGDPSAEDAVHLCGAKCVNEWLSKNLL